VDSDDEVEYLLSFAPEESQNLLRSIYLDGRSQASIARERGVSRQAIHGAVQKALAAIREGMAETG
jgi:DNA-directed RNA polymerase specialized sigma24 family protein